MRCRVVILLLGAVFILAGFGVPSASGQAYQAGEVANGGTIVGEVRFAGQPPKLEPIEVVKDQEVCGRSVPSEVLIVGPNQGLKNTVVYVEGITKGKKSPDGMLKPVLENKNCVFVPHVQAFVKGAELSVVNNDERLHNTHGTQANRTAFNVALPNKGQVIKSPIRRAGLMHLRCDAHIHMSGWAMVTDHPYVALTDENGSFKITDVPPGTYKMKAWHEGWRVTGKDREGRLEYAPGPELEQQITVPEKGEVKVSFEFKP